MSFLIFAAVLLLLLGVIAPLVAMELKNTGTVGRPHTATIIGGILGGVTVDFFTPVGPAVWGAFLYSDLGLSPLSSRALTAGILVGLGMVVALYVEALVRRVRRRSGG